VSSIRADSARYEEGSVTVIIQDFKTGFEWRSLLRNKLDFNNVRASHVEIVLVDDGDEEDQSADAGIDDAPAPPEESEPDLPVSIAVTKLNVDRLTVSGPSEEPIVFREVLIDESLIKKDFQFTEFTFRHELGQLVANGRLGFSMDADLQLDAQWSLSATETLPAIGGTSTLSGSYRQLQTDTRINTPHQFTIHANIDEPFDELKWQGTVAGPRLPLALFDSQLTAELKDLDFNWSGTLSNVQVEGSAGIHEPQLGGWVAELNGTIGTGQWILTNLELRSQSAPTRLRLQGESAKNFDYSPNAAFEARLSWDNLQWPLGQSADTSETARAQSQSGQAQWSGSLAQYKIEIQQADFSWQQHQVSTLDIKASGDSDSLTLSSYSAGYLDGQWRGSGRINWTDGLKWRTQIEVSKADTSRLWAQWPALLSGTAKVDGGLKDGDWNLEGSVTKLSGRLRDVPIDRVAFKFNAAPGDYQIRDLVFDAGRNRLAGTVFVKRTATEGLAINGNWDINAADLSQLLPKASGTLTSEATFGGTVENPELSLTASANQLQIDNYGLASMKLDARIDGKPNRNVKINLQAEEIFYQTWQLKTAILQADGLLDGHNIMLTANVDDRRKLVLQVAGTYSELGWIGQLKTADIDTGTLGEWYLPQPVALEISDQKLSVNNGCFYLRNDAAHTCFSVRSVQFNEWQGRLTVSELSANRLKSYFPQMLLETSGVFNGDANFDLDGAHIRVLKAELTSKQGALIYGFSGTEQQRFEYEAFSIRLLHTDKGVTVDANVDLKNQGEVTGHLLLKDKHTVGPLTRDQYIQGRMVLDLNDLAILHVLYPEVQFKEGAKYSEFKVEGPLGKPLFIGYTTVNVKSALIPRLGIELKDVELRLDYDEHQGIKARGHVGSGEGYLDIEGQVTDYLSDTLQASMSIQGEKFQAINTAEITADISPDLEMKLQGNELQLRGSLLILSADVKILDSAAAVAPSSDVVFIDERDKREAAAKPLLLDAQIRVTLGDHIRIQGFGAKGKLRGEVVVSEDKSGITKGSGEVYIVDGKYSAYGRELSIETGKLIYTSSPIENPLVEIKAQRRINEDVVVGVEVAGYAQNPRVTLFSEPTMDSADVLSYMMLGYPISQASQQDGATLAGAASSIGLVGGEMLAKNIAKDFGIDEVEVKSDNTTQQTSLVLGKYLSPRLYAQYAVGIGDAVNAFRIEYQLTKQWVLKTETSDEGQSTDLLFTIER
ncbi:MAG: translocation/assembly module TamB domain-containing protein, partial [Gammaproteobacteria bacterium]